MSGQTIGRNTGNNINEGLSRAACTHARDHQLQTSYPAARLEGHRLDWLVSRRGVFS